MIKESEKKQKVHKVLQIMAPIILFLYPLRHIFVGAEWWDTGYNYANFTYIDHMDEMWLFSTYLGNVVGNFFTRLPGGNTMVGLQIYTGLVVSLLALVAYYFFVKEVKLPPLFAFIGEFLVINLCWCPTALLYNYLTYVLLGACTILLYYALTRETKSKLFFVLAGICLGVNVFVRFSNLANMALIVAVWAMGIVRKEKFFKVVQQTLWCVLGYVIGLGAIFGVISMKYGASNYIQGVQRLLSMPQEASSYTMYSMIHYQIINYQQNLIWLGWLAGFMLLGMIVYQILPKSWKWIKNIGYLFAVFAAFYFLMNRNMFNMKYSTKLSVFQWAVMILTATLIAGIIVIFKKRFDEKDKLLCGLGIIVMIITPLGSNNHLYSSINNLFFIAPFTLWLMYRFLRALPKEWKVKKIAISTYPLKAMCYSIFFMIMLQGTLFGCGYVFSESDGGENLHTPIEGNEILRGMRTDPERAKIIAEISRYVSENNLKGREVVLYGEIPSMSYYLEMPFAISAWPDLPSYNYSIMESDLQDIKNAVELGVKDLPVMLMNKYQGVYAMSGKEGLSALDNVPDGMVEKLESDKKLVLLSDMIEEYNYRVTFENDKFVLFLAGTEGE